MWALVLLFEWVVSEFTCCLNVYLISSKVWDCFALKLLLKDLWEVQFHEAALKLSSFKFLCFLSSGHFLLPSSSPDGKCEHQITSPDLPGSDRQCILQVALYEAGPTVGNLTVQIKLVTSDLIVRSEVLNNRRPENHRSGTASLSFCTIISYLFSFLPQMVQHLPILLVSRIKTHLAALS